MGKSIGFIGLGTMGLPMARRLIKSGYTLIVQDIDESRVKCLVDEGARSAQTPSEVALSSSIIISMLPYPKTTEEVILGHVVNNLSPGKTLIDMSTSALSLTKKICKEVKAKGCDMLDAPVSGGEKGAIHGTLTIMVGGDKRVFVENKDIFSCLGKIIYYIGDVGTGLSMKLINNLLYSSLMCATAEALALGKKIGLDLETMVDVLGSSSGSSYAINKKAKDFIIPDNFAPGFTTNLLVKDIDLALEIGKQHGNPLIFGTLTRQLYQIAQNDGFGEYDNSSIIKLFSNKIC